MQLFITILRRLVNAVVLIAAVVVLNFLLIHAAPGDVVDVIAGEMGGITQEVRDEISAEYNLDKPVLVQLGLYLGRIVRGDLGRSFFFTSPVIDLISTRLGATLLLVFTALVIAAVGGTLLGVLASRNPDGIFSGIVTTLALVGYSTPVFWLGLMVIILLAHRIPLFPVSGMRTIPFDGGPIGAAFDVLHHLALPAFTLSIIYLAQYSRISRASMLEVLGSDYIRTARSKGLTEIKVIGKHALRNAILPVVTLVGLQFGGLISGAVLVETVFNWPGLGTLALDSVLKRDVPTILGILLFSSVVVIVANLLTDLLYQVIDPRIEFNA